MTFEKQTIGSATLYRGDCLELLQTGLFAEIGAIVSDPPYGIKYQHSGRGGNGVGFAAGSKVLPSRTSTIIGDDVPFDPVPWLDAAPLSQMRATYGGNPIIALLGADHFMQRLPTGGTLLAWDKHVGRAADDSFADCEWAWCGRKVRREVFRWMWKGICTQKSLLDGVTTVATKTTSGKVFSRAHVSQKPIELMRWLIEKVRPLPDLPVLDPYMGSGTTGIAALSLGHGFIGCEIDTEHFDIACRRIEAFYDHHGQLFAEPAPAQTAALEWQKAA